MWFFTSFVLNLFLTCKTVYYIVLKAFCNTRKGMSTKKPEPLYYVVVRDARTRPNYKTRTFTVYRNGVPGKLERFVAWLSEAIEEKVGK